MFKSYIYKSVVHRPMRQTPLQKDNVVLDEFRRPCMAYPYLFLNGGSKHFNSVVYRISTKFRTKNPQSLGLKMR